ncbi:MAG: hypothetical protein GX456_02930 [Verrucomicrobia bacterium]|nr:hypothetical protein [Verrucomicrobiota bacterium]
MAKDGAAKNRRAPARVGENNGVGSAAVLGRIEPTTDRMTCFDHANPDPEHSRVGCGQECPRSCTRWKQQRRWEHGRPRPHRADDRSYDLFPITRIGRPNIHGLGAAKNRRAPDNALELL